MQKPKIVITQQLDLYPDQVEKLHSLGDTKIYNDLAKSEDEWLNRCKGADIICSGRFGLINKYQELQDVFISIPFVSTSWADKKILKENNITLANCPGCNKEAVSEWVISMILILLRDLHGTIRTRKIPENRLPETKLGLVGKEICILGKGNIGSRVGKIAQALEMNVSYLQRGDDLYQKTKEADVIVDTLSTNPSTQNLLNEKFFNSLKKGSYFISVTGTGIVDVDAMLKALDQNILTGAANDAAKIIAGDIDDPYYQKLLANPKVLVTPHISFLTDVTNRKSNDMMIDNIEKWIKDKA